jgi:hypothetical protein
MQVNERVASHQSSISVKKNLWQICLRAER